jgi:triosephosphate isomerase (TIM)
VVIFLRIVIVRKKFVAGNWKMFTNAATARQLASAVVRGLGGEQRVSVAVCPPFPYLSVVAEALKGSAVALGAQNCYHEKEGAFTGEVSPAMLVDVGCRYVILGHSERRHKLGESDTFINRKVHSALAAGLEVILCLGETLEERQANRTESVLETQMSGSLANLDAVGLRRVVLAYEPVWAIGTGLTATPEQAQAAHHFIRGWLVRQFGAATAARVVVQYGGSVKPDNAAELLACPDIDGALVGGASLKSADFLAIFCAGLDVTPRKTA